MMLMLEVQNASTEPVPEPDTLQHWIEHALRLAGHEQAAEIVVRVVDSVEMSALNQQFRARSGPTNVLSFPADLPAELDLPLLGDIVICAPLVLAEAQEQGKPPRAHWAHLCVHGTLHLLGHDHQECAEAEHMEALESEIMRALGFACPYSGYPLAANEAPMRNNSNSSAALTSNTTTEEQPAS